MNQKVLLGITGSIAAYKSLELIRLLTKAGVEVAAVMTKNATRLLAPLSVQVLTKKKVAVESFDPEETGMHHISLAQWADVMVIAPASANIIGKAAAGIADDLLSTLLLSCPKPKLMVPAMDQDMWQNPIVSANISKLRGFGFDILRPAAGELASGRVGQGRLPPVELIYYKVMSMLEGRRPLDGKRFLVTAGRTYEKIDPVRVVTNLSSGRLGTMLAYAVLSRGGDLKMVFGETTAPLPQGAEIIRALDGDAMLREVSRLAPAVDCLIMAAAIGDYRPAAAAHKIKGERIDLALTKTPDILKQVGAKKRPGQRFIGFSLETEDALKRAQEKMKSKNLDIIVVNDPTAIDHDALRAQLLFKNGSTKDLGPVSKWQLANLLLDECIDG